MTARDNSIVGMVQYQCIYEPERAEIEKVFERLYAVVLPELESENGPKVIRVLVAAIRLANVSALMMGMSDLGAFLCVAETLKDRLNSAGSAMKGEGSS